MLRTCLGAGLLWTIAAGAQSLPEGPGKDLFSRVCAECHGLELATTQKLSKPAWQDILDAMIAKGAAATKGEAEIIVNYLAGNFGAAGATAPTSTFAEGAKLMPGGPGKDVILRECTICHLPDHFVKYRHSNEEWQAIVVRMGTRVKSATRQELDAVQKYLATNFPKLEDSTKVNVNKATAKEIEARLSLTQAEAEAVVDYRTRHGAFREWGELLAIYGVDGVKIEAARDRMSF